MFCAQGALRNTLGLISETQAFVTYCLVHRTLLNAISSSDERELGVINK